MWEDIPVSALPQWILAPAWLVYRRSRRLAYTLANRNPLRGRVAFLNLGQEWTSVRGLLQALAAPPEMVDQDSDGATLWRTALGPFWVPPGAGAEFVGRLAAEMLGNVYDLRALTRASSASVVLDCGANVGFFTRFALRSGAARVVAFEPSRGNNACLRRNAEAEITAGRVTVIDKGVWDREATLSFSTKNKGNPGGHHLTAEGAGDTQVPVTSIDDACQRLSLPRVDYIKLDVEGAEVSAILGAKRVIQQFRPWLCVATEHTDDLFANALAVFDAVQSIQPSYRCICTEAHVYSSPSRGSVMTPYSLLFYPAW
jgi:FkbM family methyltransferase